MLTDWIKNANFGINKQKGLHAKGSTCKGYARGGKSVAPPGGGAFKLPHKSIAIAVSSKRWREMNFTIVCLKGWETVHLSPSCVCAPVDRWCMWQRHSNTQACTNVPLHTGRTFAVCPFLEHKNTLHHTTDNDCGKPFWWAFFVRTIRAN